MVTARRTVSLKTEVDEVLEDKRGKKNLSKYLNEHFEEQFPSEVKKKKKGIESSAKK